MSDTTEVMQAQRTFAATDLQTVQPTGGRLEEVSGPGSPKAEMDSPYVPVSSFPDLCCFCCICLGLFVFSFHICMFTLRCDDLF